MNLLLLFMNTNKQLNKGTQMKTKKIMNGWYEIEINNNVYQAQKSLRDENFGDWIITQHWYTPLNHEIIDMALTLKEAKEVIQMIELRDNKQIIA